MDTVDCCEQNIRFPWNTFEIGIQNVSKNLFPKAAKELFDRNFLLNFQCHLLQNPLCNLAQSIFEVLLAVLIVYIAYHIWNKFTFLSHITSICMHGIEHIPEMFKPAQYSKKNHQIYENRTLGSLPLMVLQEINAILGY